MAGNPETLGIAHDGCSLELIDGLEVRDPGPGEVLVEIKASGVCHSDLSVVSGAIPYPTPVVLGHEGAGVVVRANQAIRIPESVPFASAALIGCGVLTGTGAVFHRAKV